LIDSDKIGVRGGGSPGERGIEVARAVEVHTAHRGEFQCKKILAASDFVLNLETVLHHIREADTRINPHDAGYSRSRRRVARQERLGIGRAGLRAGQHDFVNGYAIVKKAVLLHEVRLPVVENSEASAEHGVGASRRIGKSQTGSKVLVVGNVRLELMAQAQHEGKVRLQAHLILKEGKNFVLLEVNGGIAEIHREL